MATQTGRTCLFINNSPQPGRKQLAKLGGGGKSLLSLLAHLPEFGWNAHVVVPGEGQFTDALADMGIAHTIYPFTPIEAHNPLGSWRTLRSWRRLIGSVRPQLIHANGFEISRSFSLAARSLGVPYITHVRFPVEPEGARWVLRGLPKPAAFIFNSGAMRDRLWPFLSNIAPDSRPLVVHNAVDLKEFTPAPWPAAPPNRIGIIANFAKFKRHEDFLGMAAEMLKERQDLAFWVVGDDTEGSGRRAVLEKMADDLGITHAVEFLGHRLDIPDLIRKLHVLVVPSDFEPFGRVVIEAMACGRPVVGSRSGGIPEIIEEGVTGRLAEVGDLKGFARAALELIDDRTRWEAMSVAAQQAATQHFSATAHVRNIVAIYEQLTSPAP